MKFGGKGELITWTRRAWEKAQAPIDGGCSQRVEKAARRSCRRAGASVCFPYISGSSPICGVQSARRLNAGSYRRGL